MEDDQQLHVRDGNPVTQPRRFRADYVVELSDGSSITIPDIEHEVFSLPGEEDQIYFSGEECRKIEAAIELARPGYYEKRKAVMAEKSKKDV